MNPQLTGDRWCLFRQMPARPSYGKQLKGIATCASMFHTASMRRSVQVRTFRQAAREITDSLFLISLRDLHR